MARGVGRLWVLFSLSPERGTFYLCYLKILAEGKFFPL